MVNTPPSCFVVFSSPASIPSMDVMSALVSAPPPHASLFALPQDDVDHPADDGQREGHPSQDVGKAEGGTNCGRLPVRVSHSEDSCTTHHAQAGKDLEDSSKVKPSPLGERKQLAKEQEQRQHAEDNGEDHQSLDRLQPLVRGGRYAMKGTRDLWSAAVLPKVCRTPVNDEPLANDC